MPLPRFMDMNRVEYPFEIWIEGEFVDARFATIDEARLVARPLVEASGRDARIWEWNEARWTRVQRERVTPAPAASRS